MKKPKFVEDAKSDPARYYRNPFDVIRDRRLTNEDRLEVLAAWEKREQGSEADDATTDRLEQLRRARGELPKGEAANETTPEAQ